jgi:hypothetical protein
MTVRLLSRPVAQSAEEKSLWLSIDPTTTIIAKQCALAQLWSELMSQLEAPQLDPRFSQARMLSIADLKTTLIWFRGCVPARITLVFLNLPEIYEPTNPQLSSEWLKIVLNMPVALRAGLCGRIKTANAMLDQVVARLPNAHVVDRRLCLREHDVQEFAHFSRRAVYAIATAIGSVLPAPGRAPPTTCDDFCRRFSALWDRCYVLFFGGAAELVVGIVSTGAVHVFLTDVASAEGTVKSGLVATEVDLSDQIEARQHISVRRLCMQELPALMLDEPDAPNEVVGEMDRYDWSQADRVALGRVELVICDLVRCEEAAQVVARSLLAVLGTGRSALLLERDEGRSSLIEELRVGGCTIETTALGRLVVHSVAKPGELTAGPTAPKPAVPDPDCYHTRWVGGALDAGARREWVQLERVLEGDAVCESNAVWVRSVVSVPFDRGWLYRSLAWMLVGATGGPESWLLRRPAYLTTAQFCSYPADQGGHFENFHIDESSDRAGYKALSCVLFLSEPESYDGGEFQVQCGDVVESHRPAAFSAILFCAKSVMHRVMRVTRGVRRTLVFWVCDRDVSLQYEDCTDIRALVS